VSGRKQFSHYLTMQFVISHYIFGVILGQKSQGTINQVLMTYQKPHSNAKNISVGRSSKSDNYEPANNGRSKSSKNLRFESYLSKKLDLAGYQYKNCPFPSSLCHHYAPSDTTCTDL